MLRIIIVGVLFLGLNSALQLVCNNRSLNEVDGKVATLFHVGKSQRNFPVNQAQVKPYCNEQRRLVTEVDEYKKHCMQNLPKQLTSIAVYTIKRLINSLCKKNSRRLQRYLTSGPCANAAQSAYKKCNIRFIDTMLGAIHAEDKFKIPHLCCHYHKVFTCMHSSAITINGCNEEYIESNQDFLRSVLQSTMDFLCGEYSEDTDKCQKLPPVPRKKKNQRRSQSFLVPMIELLGSFAEIAR